MNEHWAAIVTATLVAITTIIVALVNKWSKKGVLPPPSSSGDIASDEIKRNTKVLGERLHDDTRAVSRRGFQDMHERFDRLEHHVRNISHELEAFMRPSSFKEPLRKLDEADRSNDDPR